MATGRPGAGRRALRGICLLALLGQPARAGAPLLPSSWFGTVTVSGAPAAAGTPISAWFAGAEIAATTSFSEAGEARYRLDVPGDLAETAAVEGPTAGQAFEIRVGGDPSAELTWTEGSYSRRDLETTAGADLGISLTDGVETVAAGGAVGISVTVTNRGPGASAGTLLEITLPAGSTASSISGGGTMSNQVVRWPLFELEEGASAERTFEHHLGESFAAGVAIVEVEARVSHDGSSGPDPVLADNAATDADGLLAEPEIGVTISDGREAVRPGDTLFYRAVVANAGSQGATGVELEIVLPEAVEYYSASHGGALADGRVRWPAFALAAGGTDERTVTVRVPADLSTEVAAIVAGAMVSDDGANGIDPDPSNDGATDSDGVEHLPDLAIDGVSTAGLLTDLQSLEISGTVAVSIANRGQLSAPAFDLLLFLDSDGEGGFETGEPELARQTVGGLAGGASETVEIAVDGAVRFRDERIFAFVDSGLVVAESDESNNVDDSALR
ncbi:MAG TPA: CARDB domain-containing protein, partial [Thermoanaerobaculia bacterium]|nr:CARDB domain-containing protein [Thermoanaerobaculia bacterium]